MPIAVRWLSSTVRPLACWGALCVLSVMASCGDAAPPVQAALIHDALTPSVTVHDDAHFFRADQTLQMVEAGSISPDAAPIVVVTDPSPITSQADWQRAEQARWGGDNVVIALHVDPASPYLYIGKGAAVSLTLSQIQQPLDTITAASRSVPALAASIVAEIAQLQHNSILGRQAHNLSFGVEGGGALVVIVPWIFMYLHRKRAVQRRALASRIFVVIFYGFITLYWLAVSVVVVRAYSSVGEASPYSVGTLIGTALVPIALMVASVRLLFLLSRPVMPALAPRGRRSMTV